MDVIAKGAFKWGNANSCAAALAEYEAAGYGVLAQSDWKIAGAYAFIDTTIELDADMVGWRESFEQLAASAQEGEVDLDAGEGSFFRIGKIKGKKKIALTTEKTGFGLPHGERLRMWGAAVEKLQKAELKATQKREADRAAADRAANAILVATHPLGGSGRGMWVEPDGRLTVLTATGLHRVGTDVSQHSPERVGRIAEGRADQGIAYLLFRYASSAMTSLSPTTPLFES
jgi:hypothetical protein